jgi:hypothetical protein
MQRLQSEVDAFRSAKESAKAMYAAAEATLRIHDALEAMAAAGLAPDDQSEGDSQATATARLQEAAETLRALNDPRGSAVDADLLELRADPLGRDVRFLMALEPAGTVTLLAVLDGEDAIAEHRNQALRLAGDLLTDIRAGDWPPANAEGPADLEVTLADPATFLARFFPADSGAIARRAADLAAAQTLAGLRGDMSLADLSTETGISERRLRDVEARGLGAAEVHEAAAYVRALGGRLTLTAVVGESAPVVLT